MNLTTELTRAHDGGSRKHHGVSERRRTASILVVRPRCGGRAIPILRGMPTLEAFQAADRGEIYLGGCLVSDEDPDFACTGFDCGLQF